MNHSLFTCRLTKDPELRRVGSGKTETSVITMRVAVDDRQRSKERPGVFLDVEAWGVVAERCGEYLQKGSLIAVSGRLERDEWTSKDGAKRDRLYVVAASVDFLSPKPVAASEPEPELATA